MTHHRPGGAEVDVPLVVLRRIRDLLVLGCERELHEGERYELQRLVDPYLAEAERLEAA